jgi:hypothetical protein
MNDSKRRGAILTILIFGRLRKNEWFCGKEIKNIPQGLKAR